MIKLAAAQRRQRLHLYCSNSTAPPKIIPVCRETEAVDTGNLPFDCESQHVEQGEGVEETC